MFYNAIIILAQSKFSSAKFPLKWKILTLYFLSVLISYHSYSKYSTKILQCWNFFDDFLSANVTLSSAHVCLRSTREKSLKFLNLKPISHTFLNRIPGMFVLNLNAFLTIIPNMSKKFNNFVIFYKIYDIFDMSSAQVCRAVSVNVCVLTRLSLLVPHNLTLVKHL